MDALAYKILSLSEANLILVGVSCAIIGFIIGFFNEKSENRAIHRSTYFAITSACFLGSNAAGLLWLFSESAAQIDLLWMVVFGVFVLIGLFGYINGVAAVDRSNHAFTSPHYAWLGLIPFLNLVLVFSKQKENKANNYTLRNISHGLLGGSAVFIGFICLAAGAWLSDFIDLKIEDSNNDPLYGDTSNWVDEDRAEYVALTKRDLNLPQTQEGGAVFYDMLYLEDLDAVAYCYYGVPNKSAAKSFYDQLVSDNLKSAFMNAGYRDVIYFWYDNVNETEMGTYSTSMRRWFSDSAGWSQALNQR